MASIPYPTMAPEVEELFVKMGSLNVTRMLAHSKPLMEGFSRMGVGILGKSSLDAALRELTILRVGVLCASEYEWIQHVTYARAVGLREEAIEAVKSGDLSTLTDAEKMAATFAEQVCRNNVVSQETLKAAEAFFDHRQLVELVMTCGYYYMTAAFLKTFDIEAEAGPTLGETVAQRWREKAKQAS